MCILLKIDYAKFGVSNLFFQKVIEERPLGGGVGSIPPPLGKGRVSVLKCPLCMSSSETFSHIFICPSGLWFLKVL